MQVNHTTVGKQNLLGEFESLKAIHDLMPGFVPDPLACGSYASIPNVHFLLMDYRDLTGDVPGSRTIPAKLAEMHKKGISPNGKFGFHIPTGLPFLHREFEQANTWSLSWEQFFTDLYIPIFHWEQKMHGADDKMQMLFKGMVEKVIPRLLRPLETGGCHISPTLLHGDLHDGNTGTDEATKSPLIFDATSFYGHNEYDLGAWNLQRNAMNRPYIDKDLMHFGKSEPVEDFEDRLKLYHQ